MVKRVCGSDAVIVRTRTFKKGGFFGLGAQNVAEITVRQDSLTGRAKQNNLVANRLQKAYVSGRKTQQNAGSESLADRITKVDDIAELSAADGRYTRSLTGAPGGAQKTNTADRAVSVQKNELALQVKSEISDLRSLVQNLVKEQRQLHTPQMPEQLFDLYLDLIQREVGEEIAREMIAEIQKEMTGNQLLSFDLVKQRLIDIMDSMIQVAGPVCRNVDDTARIVALIGPTGVGKTTTIAKLAANFKLRQNRRVGLITIDTYRIGAVDQLRTYAKIIDVPLRVVLTPAELKEAVAEMTDMDYVLIDTAGRSQHDRLKVKELQTFLDAAQPHEVHLVLSTTTNQASMVSAVEQFKKLGVNRLILTKLDEAISFGVILSAMKKIDAALSYVTMGQNVPDDIEVCTGRKLAQLLLGNRSAENNESRLPQRSAV